MILLNGKTLLFKLYRQSNVGGFKKKKQSDKKSIYSLKDDSNVFGRHKIAFCLGLILKRKGFLREKDEYNRL